MREVAVFQIKSNYSCIQPIKLQNFYQSTTSKVNRIPGRSLFVRTGWPDHSNCKENSTVNQDYPATSVYS